MKKILSIQDLSCVGKCSQTVALPILSAMGIETAILPTALLSTHTAFKNYTFRDLSADLADISRVWQLEGISFDTIYTGYLGAIEEIDLVIEIIRTFSPKLVVVDPAMGDNGRLYAGFDDEYARAMARLCAVADVVTPNITEACAILGLDYPAHGYKPEFISSIINSFSNMALSLGAEKSPKSCVITSVDFPKGRVGTLTLDSNTGTQFSCTRRRVERDYHGTGDVFSSALAGALTLGMPIREAVRLAVDFTVKSLELTLADPTAGWYGVNFEQAIPMLLRRTARYK